MTRITLLMITCVSLSGCKTLISADLFTSDLIAATEGETLTAPMVIAMEASTDQRCKENAADVLSAVQTQFGQAEFIGCDTVEFKTFGRFRVQAQITHLDDSAPDIAKPFGIGVNLDGTIYQVSFLTNPEATKAIWNALPKEMTQYQTFELEPVLSAVLNNDLRGNITITTDDVFADGVPVQGTNARDLARRDQVEIRMSDVTNAAFGTTENASRVASFRLSE